MMDIQVLKMRKPIIYFYPEKSMNISVNLIFQKENSLKFNEKEYIWNVEVNPNGDIMLNNKAYLYIYYECNSYFAQKLMKDLLSKIKMHLTFLKRN